MVKRVWLVCLLLSGTGSGAVAADAGFTVQTDKKVLVLGESLTLEIRAEGSQAQLNTIPLGPLKQNFDVYAVSTSRQSETRKGREVMTDIMTLTLYPMQSGELRVPALHYMGKTSQALSLSVMDASPQISRVFIKSGFEPARPWVRQATTLYLDIYDDGSLQWARPREIVAASAHVRQLAETQREEMLEGVNYTVHRYAWAITPLREGGMSVRFPMLDAVKFGTHLRYAATPIWLDVAPVPAYLPVHVPVGRPDVSVAALPAEMLLNRPVNRVLTVKGSGISEAGIAKLLSSIHDDENWHFYPVTTVVEVNERAASSSQTFSYVIPFQAVRAGDLHFPELNLPYYNPEKGQIETLTIAGSAIKVVNPLWRDVQKIAAGSMVLGGIASLGYFLWRRMRRTLKRRKSLLLIKNADSSRALCRALLDFDAGHGKAGGVTLQQWLHHMERVYEVDAHLHEIARMIASAHYDVESDKIDVFDLAREAEMSIKKLEYKKFSGRGDNNQSLVSRLFSPENRRT